MASPGTDPTAAPHGAAPPATTAPAPEGAAAVAPPPPGLEHFVQGYLDTLAATSPSTQRQRTWALRELTAHPGASSPAAMLTPAHVRSWLDTAATAEPPASLPGLRARASAARALAQHGERTAVLAAGTADALAPVLRMPAPPLAPGPDPDPVRRLLVAAHPDARPLAVHPAVWTRFCAHVHLLALTGEREDVMAQLALADVADVAGGAPEAGDPQDPRLGSHIADEGPLSHGGAASSAHIESSDLTSGGAHVLSHIDGDAVTPPLFLQDWEQVKRAAGAADDGAGGSRGSTRAAGASGTGGTGGRDAGPVGLPGRPSVATHVRIERGLSPRSWRMPEPARTAVAGWLADRAVLASLLRGSPPAALWLRVRPSTDLRTGALRPAGLPVSDRGLRLAFTTTLAVLALEDRALEDLSTAAVRAYARGRGPL